MSRWWRGWPGRLALAVVVPALLHAVLLRALDQAGGATVMLGAVAGTPYAAVAGMALLLLLRLHLVLVVPPLLAGWLVQALLDRAARRAAGPHRGAIAPADP